MELLIIMGDTLHNLDGFVDGRLVDRDRLETALQGSVLFDILAVFGKGGGADDLDLSPGQSRLQDVCSVHAALSVARAYQIVDLVDDQDDIAQTLDLINEALHTALKLAAELGTRHHGGHIQKIDLLVAQFYGDLPFHDLLGQTLRDGSLAHAGLANQAGIVLLAAVEDLNDPLRLLRSADDLIQSALPGAASETGAVGIQKLAFLSAARMGTGSGRLLWGLLRFLRRSVRIAEEFVQERERCSLAFLLVIRVLLRLLGIHHLHAFKGAGQLRVHILQIIIRDPHALHHLVHRLDAKLSGAFQAEALVFGLSVFDFRDKNHSNILFALGTKGWLHCVTP